MKYHKINSHSFIKKYLFPLIAVMVLSQGCASNSQNNKRLERYQPIVGHRNYSSPQKVKKTNVPKTVKADIEKSPIKTVTSSKKKVKSNKKTMAKKKPVASEAPAVYPNHSEEINYEDSGQRMRKLKHGDMVTVGLYGIPEQIEVKESIDNFGSISLPLIDVIKIVGLGTSAAERKIRDAYINSGFYTDLSVVVMAMADEYFIRGEVKKVGNYPLIGDRTLLQAITSAGGYTDYAKLSKVTILRDKKDPMVFDCHKIAKRRIADPLIHPGDIIIVPRRILWK